MRPYTRLEDRTVERRSAPRQRTLLAARIAAGEPAVTVACGVRNLSAAGAQVELESPAYLQPPFKLLMMRDGTIHEANIVWSWGKTLGLQFTATHEAHAAVPESLKMLRVLWRATRA